MEFIKSFEIKWAETDMNGHMRHSVYPDLGAHVRMSYLISKGFDQDKLYSIGIGPVLTNEEIVYLREVKMNEIVYVDMVLRGFSEDGKRWMFRHNVTKQDGKLAARIQVKGGWLDQKTRKLILAPPELNQAFSLLKK